MPLIDDVKINLRASTSILDTEVADLILAAKADLKLSGVDNTKIIDTDALIKRAIILYCKANFGLENADSEKYQILYDSLKAHLCMSQDYTIDLVVE